MKKVPNQVMLITYPDSLGGNLRTLRQALDTDLAGCAGSLHILPFFPSSGDRGFSPITYDVVEPAFGTWEDITALTRTHAVMCDIMVNHISRQSAEFRDYEEKGEKSRFAPMFFDYDAFFGGEPDPEELKKLYRRSDRPLYETITFADGTKKRLWRSFSSQQIDLDTNHPMTRKWLTDNLRALAEHGISIVRMDAYGYISKVRGTNCFFVEPQVWDLIHDLQHAPGCEDLTLLPEVHADCHTALRISAKGWQTYDFVLPMTVLHTLYSGDTRALKHWLAICPRNQFTVLDTHDGVGVYDADGILTHEEEEAVVRRVEPNLSYSYKPMDMSRTKYPSYQIYATLYSLFEEDADAMLLARAIQMFAPGIPQVYYVGLLAGSNDLSFPQEEHRAINRHNYLPEEIHAAAERPVVQRLLSLLRFRNTCPAFDGPLEIGDTPDHQLRLTRRSGEDIAVLDAEPGKRRFTITYTENGTWHTLM